MKRRSWILNLLINLLVISPILSAQNPDIQLKVVAEQANIRRAPDIGSPILHQAPQGALLKMLDKSGEWYHNSYTLDSGETLTGYVHESLTSVVGGEKMAEPKPPEIEALPPDREVKTQEIPPPQKKVPQIPQNLPPVSFSDEGAGPAPLSLALMCGGNYISGGDLNTGVQGLVGYFQDQWQGRAEDSSSALHLSWLFGGEIGYALTTKLHLEAGVEYLSGNNSSNIQFRETPTESRLALRPEIRAVPIHLTLSYALIPRLRLKGGAEWIFAECAYSYRVQQGETWSQWKGDARSQGWGLIAGLRYEREISSSFVTFVECLGRYSRLTNFEGQNLLTDSEGLSVREEGTLYWYQAEISETVSHPLLFIRERRPTEAGVSNPREARLDLSGLTLRAGIQIRF